MKRNRKGVTLGAAALAVVAAVGGGVGIAQATTGTASATSTSSTSPYDNDGCHGGGMHGMAFGENSLMTAAADYLGLSQTDLRTQMHSGKSLADVAKDRDKSVSGLKDAMVAAVKSNLADNTTLTAERKTEILAQAKEHINTMVTMTHPSGADMGSMGGMGHGMGR
ncbi:hypothetical protein [Streptomyces sp. WAC00263]|uniref:hypothetical protein n=1 Tax=Streptomyces sp. WAC00263 TaxID=1917422 RepID=UPI0015EF999E|nr:hypothetical protein [Streptomyces sp. WAC00263]KAF5990685.1 hypothetical protein BOG92_000530 [Streptomyces sp. WAC00263]